MSDYQFKHIFMLIIYIKKETSHVLSHLLLLSIVVWLESYDWEDFIYFFFLDIELGLDKEF